VGGRRELLFEVLYFSGVRGEIKLEMVVIKRYNLHI
jgi:hypothetical protein